MDRNISGPLESISAYCFKHPPIQMHYLDAKEKFCNSSKGKENDNLTGLSSALL